MRSLLIVSMFVLSSCSSVGTWLGDSNPPGGRAKVTTSDPQAAKVIITKATWAAFENYKYWLTPIAWGHSMGQGYFAVAEDGRSWGLTGCPVNNCVTGRPVSQDAIDICQSRSGGVPCSIFAKNQEVIISYEIAN
jgi:hypothetical protein